MKKIPALLFCFLLSACATYTDFSVEQKTIIADTTYKAEIGISKLYNDRKNHTGFEALLVKFQENLRAEGNRHGFVLVEKNPAYDIKIIIETNHRDCLLCSSLSGLSLFIIPSWESVSVKMDVEATNLKTKKKINFTETGKYTTYYHLFCVLALNKTMAAGENVLFAEMMNRVFNKIIVDFDVVGNVKNLTE